MAILSNGRFSGFLCSIKDTGKKLKNGAKVMVDDFLSGFNGYGWKLWKKDERWRLEIDDLLVRKSFTTFEHIISQITSIKGAYSISQGHAKIKSVSIATADVYKEVDGTDTVTQEQCYRLEIDDESNSIVEYDFVQCLNNGRYYLVQVGSVFQYYINIPVSEFDSDPDTGEILNAPQAGDEIVQFGNASHQEKYRNRHSAIYMHLDEEEPAIDLMTDLYTKDWSKAIKVRVGGNLPNTDGDRGFYSVNGKLLFVDEEGETVSVINPDGSASFAYGKLSWTKDGSPIFSGTILLKISSNKVWEVTEDGLNILGNKNGKKIVLNSDNGDISIYNDSDEKVISIDAIKYDNISDFFNSNIPNISYINLPFSLASDEPTTTEPNIKEISTFITEPFYTIQDFNVRYNWTFSVWVTNIQEYISNASASYFIFIDNYSDENLSNLVKTEALGSYYINENGKENSSSGNKSIIYKGYNVIRVVLKVSASYLRPSVLPPIAYISLDSFNISSIDDTFLCKMYSNGILIGTSNENIFYVHNSKLYDRSNLNFEIGNTRSGFKLDNFNPMVRVNNLKTYGLIPSVLFAGYGVIGSNTYWELQHGFEEEWAASPEITRKSAGIATIKAPDIWKVRGIQFDYLYYQVTGDSTGYSLSDAPIFASIIPMNANGEGKIILRQGTTARDGRFFIEIKSYGQI